MDLHTFKTGKNILTILSEEPRLSAKQVYYRILRMNEKPITYQAVHKKIMALETEGVISRVDHVFLINDKWLNEIATLINTAKMKKMEKGIITENEPIQKIRQHYECQYKVDQNIQEPFY